MKTGAGVSIAISIVVLFVLLAVGVGLTTLFAVGGVSLHMIEAETREKAVVINRKISQRAIAHLSPGEAQVELLAELFGELDVIGDETKARNAAWTKLLAAQPTRKTDNAK